MGSIRLSPNAKLSTWILAGAGSHFVIPVFGSLFPILWLMLPFCFMFLCVATAVSISAYQAFHRRLNLLLYLSTYVFLALCFALDLWIVKQVYDSV